MYLANSLSPAKVLQVEVQDQNKAVAIVPEDQLSLAIGRDGQNVRLAAKLTGWKVDIRTPEGKEVSLEEKNDEEELEDKSASLTDVPTRHKGVAVKEKKE